MMLNYNPRMGGPVHRGGPRHHHRPVVVAPPRPIFVAPPRRHYYNGPSTASTFLAGAAVGALAGSAMTSSSGRQQPSTSSTTIIYNTPPPASTTTYVAQPPPPTYVPTPVAVSTPPVALSAAPPAPPPNTIMVKVRVPHGVSPGQQFSFSLDGAMYTITCPHDVTGGQEMYTYVPARPQLADAGRAILRDALEPSSAAVHAILVKDQIVDETAAVNREHGIISAREGDVVQIIDGSLSTGMRAPYSEYCLVRILSTGREGKVSRFLLRPAN